MKENNLQDQGFVIKLENYDNLPSLAKNIRRITQEIARLSKSEEFHWDSSFEGHSFIEDPEEDQEVEELERTVNNVETNEAIKDSCKRDYRNRREKMLNRNTLFTITEKSEDSLNSTYCTDPGYHMVRDNSLIYPKGFACMNRYEMEDSYVADKHYENLHSTEKKNINKVVRQQERKIEYSEKVILDLEKGLKKFDEDADRAKK